MITSKQRSYLRSLAHELTPTVYVGKAGLTDNILKEMETGFETRELVKVKIQEGCDTDAKELANEVAERLHAEFVQAIGRRFTLYRQARVKENRKIELPR